MKKENCYVCGKLSNNYTMVEQCICVCASCIEEERIEHASEYPTLIEEDVYGNLMYYELEEAVFDFDYILN